MGDPSGAAGHRAGLALLSTPAPPSCSSSSLVLPWFPHRGATRAGAWLVTLWVSPQGTGELRAGSGAAPHLDSGCGGQVRDRRLPWPGFAAGGSEGELVRPLVMCVSLPGVPAPLATPSAALWQGAAYKCPLTSAREAKGAGQRCRTGTSRHLAGACGDSGAGAAAVTAPLWGTLSSAQQGKRNHPRPALRAPWGLTAATAEPGTAPGGPSCPSPPVLLSKCA